MNSAVNNRLTSKRVKSKNQQRKEAREPENVEGTILSHKKILYAIEESRSTNSSVHLDCAGMTVIERTAADHAPVMTHANALKSVLG